MPSSSCRFDPQQISLWSKQTGLRLFSDSERQEAYLCARPFLEEKINELLQDGWLVGSRASEEGVLFHVYKPYESDGEQGVQTDSRQVQSGELILPEEFNSFLDPSKADTWKSVFESPVTFHFQYDEQKLEDDDAHPHSRSSHALLDIFHLIQVLAPGMLTIQLENQPDNTSTTVSRSLPTRNWIKEVLPDIVSTRFPGGMEALITAANCEEPMLAEKGRTSPYWESSSDEDYFCYSDDDIPSSPIKDLTACDKECGYCGYCSY